MTITRLVVVDTDGGLDDALALHYLARCCAIQLVAVGSVHGNVPSAAAADNALRALEIAGDHSTPVTIGSAEPLAQPLYVRHPDDPFGALAGAPNRDPCTGDAVEQLVTTARAHAGAVELLTLGPLTNLARALDIEPELPQMIRRVVSMGGAIDVPGNISPYAETNVRLDPEAAERVLGAGFTLTLVGLDTTRTATATRQWLEQLAESAVPPWNAAAELLLRAGTGIPRLPLHDPLAAAVLVDETLAVSHRRAPVTVDLDKDERRGATRIVTGDRDRPEVTLVTHPDVETFLSRLTAALVR